MVQFNSIGFDNLLFMIIIYYLLFIIYYLLFII